ncbi:MAG: hypothetical protein WDM70_03855 [Nitrosomonadales bacterium]
MGDETSENFHIAKNANTWRVFGILARYVACVALRHRCAARARLGTHRGFALLYIMLALGLNIVVGYAGLLDLGYVAFFAVGAYNYALLSSPQFGLPLAGMGGATAWCASGLFFRCAAGRAPPCACAAITSPLSRWGSAKSSASFSTI